MPLSTDELDWQAELGHANRAFSAMIGGQLYENITREEANCLRQLQLAHKAVPIGHVLAPGTTTMVNK